MVQAHVLANDEFCPIELIYTIPRRARFVSPHIRGGIYFLFDIVTIVNIANLSQKREHVANF